MSVVDVVKDEKGRETRREYPCVESMTRLKLYGGFVVRVWRDESRVGKYDNSDLHEVADEIKEARLEDGHVYSQPHLVARRFAEAPRVSAVEVLDESGDGIVVYVTW